MRITLYFTALGRGGTERVLVRLASEFVRAGHEVDLVLMRLGENAYADERDSRVRIVDLGARHLKSSFPLFARYLRGERPDVVISAGDLANVFAGWAVRLVRPRPVLIFTHHGYVTRAFENTSNARSRPLTSILRHSHRLADAVVGVSDGVADNIKRLPGVAPRNVHRIYNPSWHASMDVCAREFVRCEWLELRSEPLVVAVGRLDPAKDFATLLNAFEILRKSRKVRLLVLGEGPERPALERLVHELDLQEHVLLPGFVENPFAYMARASILVLSSRDEGFGNVLVEAMACGTPVVSTDCPGGPAEILDRGRYGALVPVDRPEDMAQAIESMLDNPTDPDLLRERARKFSIEAAADNYLRLIETLMPSRPAA